MHSVILDHYTQCPFDNACHRRVPVQPHHPPIADTTNRTTTPPLQEAPSPPISSSLQGQSVLTWSPAQVLMTSPLVNWTPYLTTMATSPTAKYSLDLQISCKRTDSGFEDITASPICEPNESPIPLKNIGDITMPPIKIEDDSQSAGLPKMSSNEEQHSPSSASESPQGQVLPLGKSKRSSASSGFARTRPRRAEHAPTPNHKPATPRTSRPSSTSSRGLHCRSNSSTCGTVRSSQSMSDPKRTSIRDHRVSNRSVEIPASSKGPRPPSSSRRSSDLSLRRPVISRTESSHSFILARNEPRPIDFANIVRRTREQQQQQTSSDLNTLPPHPNTTPEKTLTNKQKEEKEEEDSTPPPPPPDYPIDWTDPSSRLAQYAEIDRQNRGATGLWRRVRRKLKIGKMVGGGKKNKFNSGNQCGSFYEEGRSDVGSVRRYRIDITDVADGKGVVGEIGNRS